MTPYVAPRNPGLSVLLSFLWAGLGQIYNGQPLIGVPLAAVVAGVGFLDYRILQKVEWVGWSSAPSEVQLFFQGSLAGLAIIWLWSMWYAHHVATRINAGVSVSASPPAARAIVTASPSASVGTTGDPGEDTWRLIETSRDKALLDQHMTLVRSLEQDLKDADKQGKLAHPVPKVDPTIELVNDNTPQISRIQIDLLVNALSNDMARVATLQYMRSVGMAQMRWLGVEEGHHSLSHDPDDKKDSYEKLMKINTWFAGEFAYLAKRLSETPELAGDGTMLDNTLLVWTNELGKGNTHTLDNIPYVMVGGGFGFKMGRSLKFDKVAHNRLWMSVAQAMGHNLQTFGKKELCEGGALSLA